MPRVRLNPPAPEFLKTIPFYHGTGSGLQVRRTGKLIPGSTKDDGDIFVPMANRVYLTPELKYALTYAGMSSSGYFHSVGYVFVVPGIFLGDVLPDEDDVGMLIYWILGAGKRLPEFTGSMLAYGQAERGINILRCLDSSSDTRYLPRKLRWLASEELPEHKVERLLQDASGRDIPSIGKALIPRLSEADMVALFSCGANVANYGAIDYTEIWRKEKDHGISVVKPDGSNFFKIADRVDS